MIDDEALVWDEACGPYTETFGVVVVAEQIKISFILIVADNAGNVCSIAQALKAEGYVGAVFTQFSDVEAELNGFFSYDRKVVKVDLQALAKMHGDLIVQWFDWKIQGKRFGLMRFSWRSRTVADLTVEIFEAVWAWHLRWVVWQGNRLEDMRRKRVAPDEGHCGVDIFGNCEREKMQHLFLKI